MKGRPDPDSLVEAAVHFAARIVDEVVRDVESKRPCGGKCRPGENAHFCAQDAADFLANRNVVELCDALGIGGDRERFVNGRRGKR